MNISFKNMFKDIFTKIIGHHKVPEESLVNEIEKDTLVHDDIINKSETAVKIRTPLQSVLQESHYEK